MPRRRSDVPMLDNPVLRHLMPPLADLTRWLDAHFVPHAVFGPLADAILWQPKLCCSVYMLAALPKARSFVRDAYAYGFSALEGDGSFIYEPAQIEVHIRRPVTETERQAIAGALRIHLYDVAVSVVAPRDHIALSLEADQDVTELLAAFPEAAPAEPAAAVRGARRSPAVLSALY